MLILAKEHNVTGHLTYWLRR